MGGAIQPLGFGQAQNTSNYGSAFQPLITAQDIGIQDPSSLASMNVNAGLDTGSSSFMDMFSGGNKGFQSSFMGQVPGYILGGLSYIDQNKTNKLNRKATQYALDRKKTEDKAYDKYKSDWSKMSFA